MTLIAGGVRKVIYLDDLPEDSTVVMEDPKDEDDGSSTEIVVGKIIYFSAVKFGNFILFVFSVRNVEIIIITFILLF